MAYIIFLVYYVKLPLARPKDANFSHFMNTKPFIYFLCEIWYNVTEEKPPLGGGAQEEARG